MFSLLRSLDRENSPGIVFVRAGKKCSSLVGEPQSSDAVLATGSHVVSKKILPT
jgi:hypothetical protein